MRKALLGSMAMVAGAGWASAQSPRLPSAVMPPPAAVAPAGIMPASMDAPAMPDAMPMGAPVGAMPGGPMPGDGFGMPPAGMYPQGPVVDNAARLAPKFEYHLNYLLYFSKSQPTPGALVTTSSPGAGGILGGSTTQVLHGGSDFGMGLYSGFDMSGILWKDPDRRIGFELRGMMTETKNNGYVGFSDATGQPLLARPFFNAQTGQQDALLVAFPNAIVGGITSNVSTHLYGASGGFAWNLYRSCPTDYCLWTVNWHSGFQFFELNEQLSVTQTSQLINGAQAIFDQKLYAAPARIGVRDDIQALNQFYGGSVGISTEVKYGRVFLASQGRVGIGVMHQRLNVAGFSSINDPNSGANSTIRGGLLANASNIGRRNNDEFALVPEASVQIGYNWTSWFTTTMGYGFTYMNNVIRPGDQVSTTVNPALVPAHPAYGGAAVPVPNPAFTQTDFWVQGATLGFIFRW
jgi:hypothetical protein